MLNEIKSQILNAVSFDFNQIIETISSENIFAIALTTPSYDFGSIRLCVGTIQDLFDISRDEEFEDMSWFAGSAWNPDEWKISSDDINNSKIAEVNDIIGNNIDYFDKKFLLEIYIESIKNIVCKDLIFKFISTIEDENIENYSSRFLNTEKNHQLFLKRFEHFFDFYPNLKIKKKIRKLP